MSGSNSAVRTGIVVCFTEGQNRGWLQVSGEAKEVEFSLDSQRVVREGPEAPQFGDHAPKRTIVPQVGAHVMVAVKVGFDQRSTQECRTLRRTVTVTGWNYVFEWQDVQKRIARRPRPSPSSPKETSMVVVAESPKPVVGNGDSAPTDEELIALAASVNGRRAGTTTPSPAQLRA